MPAPRPRRGIAKQGEQRLWGWGESIPTAVRDADNGNTAKKQPRKRNAPDDAAIVEIVRRMTGDKGSTEPYPRASWDEPAVYDEARPPGRGRAFSLYNYRLGRMEWSFMDPMDQPEEIRRDYDASLW